MYSVKFLVTIDTEEEREWSSGFLDHTHYTVENIQYLEPLQQVFNKYGIKPTYLIDYPVAIDKKAMEILNTFRDRFGAEIGTHVHPWVNPPYEEERTIANSFPANLPPELQLKKMRLLTDLIADTCGARPVTYRAGRYGFNESSIPVLKELGYTVDTSIVPFREQKKEYEPHFGFLESTEPYYMDSANIKHVGGSGLLQVPLTVGFSKKIPRWLARNYTGLPNIGIRRLLKKVFDIDLYWLRPSYANLKQMKQLSATQIGTGATFLNMMFHSNELMPGGSKYCQSAADVDAYLQRLDAYFKWLTTNYSVKFVTLRQMPQFYAVQNQT